MAEDTAVLAPDTPASLGDAQPPSAPDTQPSPGARETDGTQTPETETTTDPFTGLDDDSLSKHPRLAALIEKERTAVEARTRESERRRHEADQKRLDDQRAAQEYSQGLEASRVVEQKYLGDAIGSLVAATVDMEIDPDVPKRWQAIAPQVQALSQQLLRAAEVKASEQFTVNATKFLKEAFPDFRIPPDKLHEYDVATTRGDASARTRVYAEIIQMAAVEAAQGGIREEALKDYRKEAEEALKAEREKAASAVAANGQGPTSVPGRPATNVSYKSKLEASRLFMQGIIDKDEMRRANANKSLPEI